MIFSRLSRVSPLGEVTGDVAVFGALLMLLGLVMCAVDAIFDSAGVCTVEGGVLVEGANVVLTVLGGVLGDEAAPRGEFCGLLLVPFIELGPCALGETGPVLLGALKCSAPEGMYTEVVRCFDGGVVLLVSIAAANWHVKSHLSDSFYPLSNLPLLLIWSVLLASPTFDTSGECDLLFGSGNARKN